MDVGTNKRISDYIAYLATQYSNLIKAYLFGSYAKDLNNSESDIDLALIIKDLDDDNRFDFQVQLMLIASEFDIRIEPHPISNKDFNYDNPFAAEIISTGIEIIPEAPEEWYN